MTNETKEKKMFRLLESKGQRQMLSVLNELTKNHNIFNISNEKPLQELLTNPGFKQLSLMISPINPAITEETLDSSSSEDAKLISAYNNGDYERRKFPHKLEVILATLILLAMFITSACAPITNTVRENDIITPNQTTAPAPKNDSSPVPTEPEGVTEDPLPKIETTATSTIVIDDELNFEELESQLRLAGENHLRNNKEGNFVFKGSIKYISYIKTMEGNYRISFEVIDGNENIKAGSIIIVNFKEGENNSYEAKGFDTYSVEGAIEQITKGSFGGNEENPDVISLFERNIDLIREKINGEATLEIDEKGTVWLVAKDGTKIASAEIDGSWQPVEQEIILQKGNEENLEIKAVWDKDNNWWKLVVEEKPVAPTAVVTETAVVEKPTAEPTEVPTKMPEEQNTSTITYSYSEALDIFQPDTEFGQAIRFETEDFPYGKLPSYFYYIEHGTKIAKRVDITEPKIIKTAENNLEITFENGSKIIWNEIVGWIIPQFSTKLVTVNLDIDNQFDDKVEAITQLDATTVIGIRTATIDDYKQAGKIYKISDVKDWFTNLGYSLENSPLLDDVSSPEEVIDNTVTTAFAIVFYGKNNISDEELLAINAYQKDNSTPEQDSLLQQNSNFKKGQPLTVTIDGNIWYLDKGVEFIVGIMPEEKEGYLDSLYSKRTFDKMVPKNAYLIDNGRLLLRSTITNKNSWSIGPALLQILSVMIATETNIEPNLIVENMVPGYENMLDASMATIKLNEDEAIFLRPFWLQYPDRENTEDRPDQINIIESYEGPAPTK